MAQDDDEYRVGPGRPPRTSQFRKGQSGNPRGRPKGSLNVRTVLLEELAAEVTLKGGETISLLRAIVRQQARLAAKGDLRAIESVLDRAERCQAGEPDGPSELPEEDAAILHRFGHVPGPDGDGGVGHD